jgi:hypothetical protein
MNGKKRINYERKEEREMNKEKKRKEKKRKRKQAHKQICTRDMTACVRLRVCWQLYF